MMSAPTTAATEGQPADWVPVERRWLGLDRRTIPPALVVIGLLLVLAVVFPLINLQVPYDDEVRAGDLMEVRGGVQFVPTPGWGIESGLRVGDPTATGEYPEFALLVKDDVGLSITTGNFDGDLNGLIEQMKKTTDALHDRGFHVTGDPQPFHTATGVNGLLARFSNATTDGVIAALLFDDGLGVRIIATGPPDADESLLQDVGQMIASVNRIEEGS